MQVASPRIKTVESKTWASSLKNANKTKAESCTFINHLISISISNILFLREVFSVDNFEAKEFEGMTIRFLKVKPDHRGAEVFVKWLNGAFEAVEKKYLRHLMLEIKDPNAEKTLELYTMSFDYDKGKECMNFSFKSGSPAKPSEKSKRFTLTDIQTKTVRLLQMCHAVTKTCSSLPPTVSLSIRLVYNDHTPDGYQPNGYKPCRAMTFEFPGSTRKIEIGVVETKFHSFKLISKTCLNDANFSEMDNLELNEEIVNNDDHANDKNDEESGFQFDQDLSPNKALEEICSESSRQPLVPTNFQMSSTEKDIDSGTETELSESMITLCHEKEKNLVIDEDEENILTVPFSQSNLALPNEDLTKSAFEFPSGSQEKNTYNQGSEQIVKCVCGCSQKSPNILQCSHCRHWSHAECYGIFEAANWENFNFFCVQCNGQTKSAICHDNIFLSLDERTQKKLACFRRVLYFCKNYEGKLLTINRIEKVLGVQEKKLCDVMARKLLETKVVKESNRKNNYVIDRQVLEEKIPQYSYHLDDFAPKSSTQKRKRQPEDASDKPATKKQKASITNSQRVLRKS